jgi:virginiamycin B lyase
LTDGRVERLARVTRGEELPVCWPRRGFFDRAGIQLWVLMLFGALLANYLRGQTLTEFPVPTMVPLGRGGVGYLTSIAAGPDGALWFTEDKASKIGRIPTAGVFTEYTLPGAGEPAGIVAGPDGALWFTENDRIGRITTAGQITEFSIGGSFPPYGIVAGPDGALWFTRPDGTRIGRITTGGVLSEFIVPTVFSRPFAIAAGSDGALWFTELNARKIGRITTAGVIDEFTIPTRNSSPLGITAGPDGALWFTEGSKIGRITTAGVITEFNVPTAEGAGGIAAGPDGALWFTGGEKIGRITTAGAITGEFAIPTPNSVPLGIAAGPDGAVWFTEWLGNKIGRLGLPLGVCSPDVTTLCLNNGRFRAQTQWTTAQGLSGFGQAVALTEDSGYFWFFSDNNVEILVKVLSGCGVNSRFWTFAGGLTNIRVVMTVADTQTGTVRTYTNPQGTAFQAIQDTNAFENCPTISGFGVKRPAEPEAAAAAAYATKGEVTRLSENSSWRAVVETSPKSSVLLPCSSLGGTTLCLNVGRFQVNARWFTADGRSGPGQAVRLTIDSGYFWFFSPNNVELVVKVSNACDFNSRFWTFASGLTNVNVVITVTDTQTGAVRTYTNPQNTPFQPVQDTNAFATCP